MLRAMGMQNSNYNCSTKLSLVILVTVCMLILTYQSLIWIPIYYCRWVELPAARAEVERIPGVVWRGIRDMGQPDEPSVEVILDIPHKGPIALFRPSRAGVLGDSELAISGIGQCVSTPLLIINRPGYPGGFEEFHIWTFADLLSHYDEVYARVQAKDYCIHRERDGPRPNQSYEKST